MKAILALFFLAILAGVALELFAVNEQKDQAIWNDQMRQLCPCEFREKLDSTSYRYVCDGRSLWSAYSPSDKQRNCAEWEYLKKQR